MQDEDVASIAPTHLRVGKYEIISARESDLVSY